MKSGTARELKQVLIPGSVVCLLALIVGSVAVAHGAGRGGGGGGGGGYTRGGAASTGSFTGGAVTARQIDHPVAAARVADNRRDIVDNGHRDHPVAAAAVAARTVDNRRDYVGGGGGAYYAELPCSSSETYVDGVMYYACGTTYYVQSYSGGSVIYVPSPPPPGY